MTNWRLALTSLLLIGPSAASADTITRCNFSVHVLDNQSRIREQNPTGCAVLSASSKGFYSRTKPMPCPPGHLQYGPIQGGVIDTYILDKKSVYTVGSFELLSLGHDEAIVTHESRRTCISVNNIPKEALNEMLESTKPKKTKAQELLESENED